MRICRKCELPKEDDQFKPCNGGRNLRATCRSCNNNQRTAYLESNPEIKSKYRGLSKDWVRRNTDKHRQDVANGNKTLHDKAIYKLGGRCVNPGCRWINMDGSRGCTDYRCLQIDHVNGDGAIDRKKFKHILTFYRFVIDNDVDSIYQVLCANCNWTKRHENQECRKQIAA